MLRLKKARIQPSVFAQAAVAFASTWLVESVSNDKLLFMPAFKDDAQAWFLDRSLYFMIFLGLLSLFIAFQAKKSSLRQDLASLFNRICKHIFETQLKDLAAAERNNFRVSLLTVHVKWTFNKAHRFRIGRETVLQVAGRYQIQQDSEKVKVSFKPNQGCAGKAYYENMIVSYILPEYSKSNPKPYIQFSVKNLNLTEKQVLSLNKKCCRYLCIPLRYHGTTEVYAVLSIDGAKSNWSLTDDSAHQIERELAVFSTVFQNQ
jgi:hypothetical protein